MTRPRKRAVSAGHLLVFVPAAMLASLYLAWQVSAVGHFFYPLWYGVLDIDGHIERFGPENRYRDGFETTTDEERFRLQHELSDAKGLLEQGRRYRLPARRWPAPAA